VGQGLASLEDSVRNGIDKKLSPNRKSGVGSEIGWFRVVNQELIENEVIKGVHEEPSLTILSLGRRKMSKDEL